MLALTEDACHAIEGILENADDGTGIRIAPNLEHADGGTLQLSVAPMPGEGDQVIESDGGPVFVDPAATPFLDDKVLDADVNEDAVRFEILVAPA